MSGGLVVKDIRNPPRQDEAEGRSVTVRSVLSLIASLGLEREVFEILVKKLGIKKLKEILASVETITT